MGVIVRVFVFTLSGMEVIFFGLDDVISMIFLFFVLKIGWGEVRIEVGRLLRRLWGDLRRR